MTERGAFEEGYPGDRRATFLHGVFDAAPIVFTELANAPDWLPLTIYLNGERFSLNAGLVESFKRILDLADTGDQAKQLAFTPSTLEVSTLTPDDFAQVSLLKAH